MPTNTTMLAAAAPAVGGAAPQPLPSVPATTTYHPVDIDGICVF